MVSPLTVFLLHLTSTLFMAGLIWFIQIVHYPLFSSVGAEQFSRYEASHIRGTSWVVLAPMILEASTGIWLVWQRPPGMQPSQLWVGLVLIGLIWFVTLGVQAPLHGRLRQGFNPMLHRQLVRSNWIRTVAWSARGFLVIAMAGQLIGKTIK